ncbi:MAG: hemolysin family protein [Phycisphaerales bacterium]
MTAASLWIGLGAVVLGAVCSAVHQSLRSLSRSRLEHLAETRPDSADRARLGRILDDRTGHAASVALPRVALNIVAAVAILAWVAELRSAAPAGPAELSFTVTDALIAGLITTVVLWVFGLVIPLSIATHAAERIVLALAGPIRAAHAVTAPFRRIVDVLDETIRRLVGAETRNGHDAQAEIMSVVEESEAEGQLDEAEREMIEGVVSFRTTTVERVMTPRTDIDAIELTDDLAEVQRMVKEIGHSRIPVYRDNMDDIVGILYAKDLLHWLSGTEPDAAFNLESLVRPALFVPEQKTVRELLTELVAQKVHLAMVADEYGGTSGLVTIEDIIEEVFGDIRDEYELEEDDEPTVHLDLTSGAVESDAGVYVDDLNDELEALDIEVPESDDYDTVGGFVVTTLGRIPEPGESISLDRATLTILEAAPTRVLRVRIQRLDEAPPTREPDGAHAAEHAERVPDEH